MLKPLTFGEKVLFKLVPNGPWINGKITQIDKYPRSYIVEGEKKKQKHSKYSSKAL